MLVESKSSGPQMNAKDANEAETKHFNTFLLVPVIPESRSDIRDPLALWAGKIKSRAFGPQMNANNANRADAKQIKAEANHLSGSFAFIRVNSRTVQHWSRA